MNRIDRQALPRYVAADFNVNLSVSASALATNINGALSTINGLGGGLLLLPEGTFAPSTGITLQDKVYLEGAGTGATVLDLSAMVTPVSSAAIYGTGSVTALPALASSIVINSRTIVFASTVAETLSAGDILIISDSADYSFSGERDYYRAGEFVRVHSVSTVTVTTSNPMFAGYASGGTVTVSKLTPIQTGLNNIDLRNHASYYGLSLRYASDFRLDSLDANGSDYANIILSGCYDGIIENCRSFSAAAAIGYNYGLAIGYSQKIVVSAGNYETTRHGLAIGSGLNVLAVPNRDILIEGATVSSSGSSDGILGADCHGNCEFVSWKTCTLPRGIATGGDHITIQGCHIRTGPGGIAWLTSEMLGWNFSFIDNDVTVTEAHASLLSFMQVVSGTNCTRADGVFTFKGNRIRSSTYGALGGAVPKGLYVYLQNGETDNEAVIEDNDFVSLYATVTTAYSFYVRGSFRVVRFNGQYLTGLGARFELTGSELLELSGNTILRSKQRGLHVVASGTALALAVVKRNITNYCHHVGIEIGGTQATTVAVCEGNLSLNNAQTATGSSTTDTSIYLANLLHAVYRFNVVGDNQGSPTQQRADSAVNVTTLDDAYNRTIGTITTVVRSGVTTTNFVKAPLVGSETKDWGSIADGDNLTEAVTVTGAALGDIAHASMSVDITGLQLTAYVSATDTVTCVLSNTTGSAVDLGSGTLRAIVQELS